MCMGMRGSLSHGGTRTLNEDRRGRLQTCDRRPRNRQNGWVRTRQAEAEIPRQNNGDGAATRENRNPATARERIFSDAGTDTRNNRWRNLGVDTCRETGVDGSEEVALSLERGAAGRAGFEVRSQISTGRR